MTLLTRNCSVQKRATAFLCCPPKLLMKIADKLAGGGISISDKFSLAEPRTDKVYNNACAGYRNQACEVADGFDL